MDRKFSTKILDTLIKNVNIEIKLPLGIADVKFSPNSPLMEWWNGEKARSVIEAAAERAEKKFIEAHPDEKIAQLWNELPLSAMEDFQRVVAGLLKHVDEGQIAGLVEALIVSEWKGVAKADQIKRGLALYLPILRNELMGIKEFREIIASITLKRVDEATQQTNETTRRIEKKVDDLNEKLSPQPETVPSMLFTVPKPVDDFTGRKAELDEIKSSFERGAYISGMTGGGGMGKTHLARRLVLELGGRFPDAHLEINLKGTALGSDTPKTVEQALRELVEPFYPGQKLPDEREALEKLFKGTFSNKRALLVLDNAASAAQVRALLPPAPSAAIVTSRVFFTLSEGGLFPKRLELLTQADARDLLRRATPKLAQVDDQALDGLAQLCGRLPLALRIAAALLNDRIDLELDELVSSLKDERTRLKKLKRADDPDLDVEAAINLSYQRLGEELKLRLRCLAVMAAPFEREAAAALWGQMLQPKKQKLEHFPKSMHAEVEKVNAAMKPTLEPIANELASEYLGNLHRLSLVDYDHERKQYSLHDLVRLFALGRVDDTEGLQSVEKYAAYYLKIGRQCDDEYEQGFEQVVPALARFKSVWPHLEAAWGFMARGWGEKGLRPAGADGWLNQFPGVMPNMLELQLTPRQRIVFMEHALDAARKLGERRATGVHLGNLGLAYSNLGETRRAIGLYEERLVIAREIGDRRGAGNALGNLGLAYADLGETRRAIGYHEEQLVIAREIGDRRGEGNALGNLGIAYAALGETRRAIGLYEERLVIAREIGDRRGEGAVLGNLGNAYSNLGETRRAIGLYEERLVIAREIGDREGEGAALGSLGNAYADLGETRRAIGLYEERLVIAREIGDRRGEGAVLGNLGLTYAALGETRRAIGLYEEWLVIAREIGDRRGEGNALGSLGVAYGALGETRRAIGLYEERLVIAREIGDRRGAGIASWNMGLLLEKEAEFERAAELMQVVVDFYTELGHPQAQALAEQVAGVRAKAKLD